MPENRRFTAGPARDSCTGLSPEATVQAFTRLMKDVGATIVRSGGRSVTFADPIVDDDGLTRLAEMTVTVSARRVGDETHVRASAVVEPLPGVDPDAPTETNTVREAAHDAVASFAGMAAEFGAVLTVDDGGTPRSIPDISAWL